MEEILKGILNALQIEIVFVDTTHTIRFMNKFAINNYKDRFGTDLVGKSIFNCHNENSKKLILKGFEELVQGKDKVQVFENEKIKEYMIAVRNEKGSLLGYFEIIERI
ncbi:PAS domain-containing protein [Caldisericum exile]|nr:PAS domain-containing protein [Caldisericum exile]